MKKIYLSALAISIATLSFAQVAKQNYNPIRVNTINPTKSFPQVAHNKGAVLWSDDFSNISTWNLVNTSSPVQDWIYTTDPTEIPVISPNPVSLSTAFNGYLYIDSDALGNGNTQVISATNVTAIDLTGNPNVSLNWEQDYISFQETFIVSVSGDNGSTWTDYTIDGGGGQAEVYESKNLNISSVAGGQSQVFVRFTYNGAWDWMWSIDDVSINITDDNELIVTDGYYGTAAFPYTRIPVDQIQPIDFSIKATNIGAVNQSNTILTADVNSGLFTGTSAPLTVNVSATDSLVTTTQFTPPTTVGVPYTVTLTVASDSVDITPANNTESFNPFEVSNFIYAYDDYGAPGAGGGTNGGVQEFEAGNYFDIFVADDLYAIDVVIGTGTPVGTNIEGVLYEFNGTFNPITTTNFYSTTAGDIGNVVNLIFNVPPTLNAGATYFAAVHTFSTFFYGTSGTSPDGGGTAAQTSLIFYPTMALPNTNQNFFTSQTPMIRMNFDPNIVGVDELSSTNIDFNVYPNPSTGEFNIDLSSENSENVKLTIKNVVGQTIIDKTISVAGKTVETISLHDYSKGVYFLTIDNKTVELIVE